MWNLKLHFVTVSNRFCRAMFYLWRIERHLVQSKSLMTANQTQQPTHNEGTIMNDVTTRVAMETVPTETYLTEEDIVCINVAGVRYETLKSTLEHYPMTLLGNHDRRRPYFIKSKNCYFFDRNPQCFIPILHYYQTKGLLVRPPDVPMAMFLAEIEFFDLGKNVIAELREKEGYTPKVLNLPKNSLQRRLWLLFEEPESSFQARVLACWSIIVIATSIILFCMETMPVLQGGTSLRQHPTTSASNASSTGVPVLASPDISYQQPWFSIEMSCIVWFTFEYVVRFVSSPSKCQFFWSFLNLIDLAAILPYFIILTVSSGQMSPILRVMRLVRVFRVFKFSRHSLGLQILGQTLRASVNELCMLIFFLAIAVILFSSAIYYAESGHNPMFRSIPDAFWYSLVTMTTVGYGDKSPITFLGKCIGSLCAISGVLTIALPVPVIVSNFEFFYKRLKDRLD